MSLPVQILALVGFVVVAFIPASTGAFFMPGEWYARLAKPTWNPPNWIFGPVWTVLFLTIGVAAWLVWRRAGFSGARAAWAVFAAQLVFNGLWTCLFFGLHRPGLAMVDIVALWAAIAGTIALFFAIDRTAGAILVPYLLWVSFAMVLNFTIWRLNS